MDPILLTAAADSANPWWVTVLKDVGVPVFGAGAILWWVATQLMSVLREILGELRSNTRATVDFTASQREHTASVLALKGEVTTALAALKGQVAEVERDVEALGAPLREITGPHTIPPEFRRKIEGGKKKEGG